MLCYKIGNWHSMSELGLYQVPINNILSCHRGRQSIKIHELESFSQFLVRLELERVRLLFLFEILLETLDRLV